MELEIFQRMSELNLALQCEWGGMEQHIAYGAS